MSSACGALQSRPLRLAYSPLVTALDLKILALTPLALLRKAEQAPQTIT